MKVYFTGSLHNPHIDEALYKKIISILEKLDCTVEAFSITQTRKDFNVQSPPERAKYYQKLKKLLSRAEVVVAEVSYPSTINIGHKVSLALDMGKPTVAIYRKERSPGLLQGIDSEKFVLLEYEDEELKAVLEYGLEEAQHRMDVRFNFFISPTIEIYLDEVSKKMKIPRAVYLRRLIEEDMKNNREYSE